MGLKFFQVGINTFYPRLVSPGMTEVSFTEPTKVWKITNDKIRVEEVESSETTLLTLRVGRTKWEEIFSTFKVPPTMFLDHMIVEVPVSTTTSKFINSSKRLRITTIYSTTTESQREETRRLRLEQVSSVITFSNIEETRRLTLEQFSSVIAPNLINLSGTSLVEDIFSYNFTRFSPTSDIGGTENLVSNVTRKLIGSIDGRGMESMVSNITRKLIHSGDTSGAESVVTTEYDSKPQTIDLIGTDASFSEPVREVLQSTDLNSTEIVVQGNTKEILKSIDAINSELLTRVVVNRLNFSSDTTKLETAITLKTRGNVRTQGNIVSEEISSVRASKLVVLVDRYISEVFAVVEMSKELHATLRQTLIEQTSATIANYIQSSTDSLNSEVVISEPPVPGYGLGIGALLRKIFVETATIPPKSIILKKVFIEKAVIDISSLYTSLYLQTLIGEISTVDWNGANLYVKEYTAETSFPELLGAGTNIYVDDYTPELSIDDSANALEYINSFVVELSYS